MDIPRLLRERVLGDARAGDYWYVPKGQAADPENWPRIAEHLRILNRFDSVPWAEAQPRFERELRRRGLIKPYRRTVGSFSAVARMQFPVWRLLGLAWVTGRGHPEVTAIGRQFLGARSERERRRIVTMQLHRYQYWNPSLPRRFATFRTFPVLALYRVLDQTDYRLTWEELNLFGNRARSFEDADRIGECITRFRDLGRDAQRRLIAMAEGIPVEGPSGRSALVTARRDRSYVAAVLRGLNTLDDSGDGLAVRPENRKEVRRIVVQAASSAEYVDYRSEEDWLAFYGQEPGGPRSGTPWTTAADARQYYEEVGEVEAAVAAFKKEKGERRGPEVERYQSVQVVERVLEDLLEANLAQLEEGLTLVGRQYATAVGPIDLLARDRRSTYVVIELKRGATGDRVVGQIARYMGWVVRRLAGGKRTKVRGIIVGQAFDRKLEAAIEQLGRVVPYQYDIRARFERWTSEAGRARVGRSAT